MMRQGRPVDTDPEKANRRALADARCAWRKLTPEQREELRRWQDENAGEADR